MHSPTRASGLARRYAPERKPRSPPLPSHAQQRSAPVGCFYPWWRRGVWVLALCTPSPRRYDSRHPVARRRRARQTPKWAWLRPRRSPLRPSFSSFGNRSSTEGAPHPPRDHRRGERNGLKKDRLARWRFSAWRSADGFLFNLVPERTRAHPLHPTRRIRRGDRGAGSATTPSASPCESSRASRRAARGE